MTDVIINDILPLTQIIATGGQTVFSTNWTANYYTDVVVYQTPAGEPPDDVTQILPGSAYTVSYIGDQNIVQVTFVSGANAGDMITITRQTPADRLNLYTNTNFTPTMLNQDIGILTLVDQQNQLVNQQVGPRYNYSQFLRIPTDTILPILGPNQVWMKDSGNDAIIAVDFANPSGGGGNISSWQIVTVPSQLAAVTEGFITDRASTPVQIILPAIFNIGDEVAILGLGAGGWSLVANTGQTIVFGSVSTSMEGSINSDIANANIFVRGLVANTTWTVEIVNSNPTYL
jgi:hypothetical protein